VAYDNPIKIEWEDPPGQGVGQPRRYAEALNELRRHPGVWGKLAGVINSAASSRATQINKGQYPETVKGEFEATTRVDKETKERHLYVRYVGKTDDTESA
jgi:hypothetical protein